MVFAIVAIVVGCLGSAYVGMKAGFKTGYLKGGETGIAMARQPSHVAQIIVHSEGCSNCGPALDTEVAKARLLGVPTDHPNRKTGQYL